jgi:hypothetical protein
METTVMAVKAALVRGRAKPREAEAAVVLAEAGARAALDRCASLFNARDRDGVRASRKIFGPALAFAYARTVVKPATSRSMSTTKGDGAVSSASPRSGEWQPKKHRKPSLPH